MEFFQASSALAEPTTEDAMAMIKAALVMKATGQLEISLPTTEAPTAQAKAVTTELPTAPLEETATAQAEAALHTGQLENPQPAREAATPQAKAVITDSSVAPLEDSATAQVEAALPAADTTEPVIAEARVVHDGHQPFPNKVGNVEFKDGRHWLHV
ncbi:MAG: hypothetical protein ACRCZI_06465 [Cetobacterium sp.]